MVHGKQNNGGFDPFPRAARKRKTSMKQSALQTLARTAKALKNKAYILSLASIPILFTGCASITDGGPRNVTINSNPEGAKVTIYDRRGRQVTVQTTPTTVALRRGKLFRKDEYRVALDMPGYRSCDMRIDPVVNRRYFGNFLLLPFSPIGFLVDPATGAMWTIRPSTISCTLRQ
jgi:PEGA domain